MLWELAGLCHDGGVGFAPQLGQEIGSGAESWLRYPEPSQWKGRCSGENSVPLGGRHGRGVVCKRALSGRLPQLGGLPGCVSRTPVPGVASH